MAYCTTLANDGTHEYVINNTSFTDITTCQTVLLTGQEFQELNNLLTVTNAPYDIMHGAQLFASFFLPTVMLYFSTRSAMVIYEIINKNLK